MPQLRDYHIFISHSWDYSYQYETVKSFLNSSNCFLWTDYSVPITKPLTVESTNDLKRKLRTRISLSSCVIILSGMYVSYSDWIEFEIKTALAFEKPIIAVRPRSQERIPRIISENADVCVGWNSTSIVEAVRNYAL